MRMLLRILAGSLFLIAGSTFAQTMPDSPVAQAFPHVLATLDLQPGQPASVTVPDAFFTQGAPGEMTIYIPAGAFHDPVRFQLLANTNAHWDGMVGSGLKAVANFAYRVLDLKTGSLVEGFDQPLSYTVSDGMIDAHSVYWAIKPGAMPTLVNANAATVLHGTVLSHPTPTAAVGWVITTPKADLAGMMPSNASSGSMTTMPASSGSGTKSGGSSGNGM